MLFCPRSNSRAGKKFLKLLNYPCECFKQALSICTLVLTMIKSESNISSTGHWTVGLLASIKCENIYGKLQKNALMIAEFYLVTSLFSSDTFTLISTLSLSRNVTKANALLQVLSKGLRIWIALVYCIQQISKCKWLTVYSSEHASLTSIVGQ